MPQNKPDPKRFAPLAGLLAGALVVGALASCSTPRANAGPATAPAPPTMERLDDGDVDADAPAPGGSTGLARAGGEPVPLTVPLFDGSARRTHQPPAGRMRRPAVPDYRRLYDMVLACWPAESWFRGELYVEGRASTRTNNSNVATVDATTGTVTQQGGRYVALVARIPLYSNSEIDRERNREAQRNGRVADAVGDLVSAFSERVMMTRQLELARALEKRAQERVQAGVADTAEQVHYLEQVAGYEVKIQNLQATEIKAKLHMVGMCGEAKMRGIDSYLTTFNQVR